MKLCARCGHTKNAHTHYRGAREFSLNECGLCSCRGFRRWLWPWEKRISPTVYGTAIHQNILDYGRRRDDADS